MAQTFSCRGGRRLRLHSRCRRFARIGHSFAKWTVGAGFGAATLFTGAPAIAEEVRISGGDCASEVRLVARDARLSDVLKRLATALDFQLSFDSESDPLISVDAARSAIDLVVRLAPMENLSIIQVRNPRCPQHERILKVWVLPKGQGSIVHTTLKAPEIDDQARRTGAGNNVILNGDGTLVPRSAHE
jgi:hypothetical protein